MLITVDQKIRYEHNLALLPVSVLELDTRDTRLAALEAMAAHIEAALVATESHRFVSVDKDGKIVRDAAK